MGGHTAADRQDTLRNDHALDVLGGGFTAHKHDLLAAVGPLLGVLSGEHNLAAGGARRSGQTLADDLGGLEGGGVELRMQQGVKLFWLHAQDSLALVDHTLVNKVDSDLQSGGGGALAVTGLKHVELAGLNGELHVLHVLIMLLETVGDLGKLVVNLRHILLEVADRGRSAHAGDNVLALRVDQIFAEQRLFTGGRIAGERNACAGAFAGVAEHHLLDVDGSAPVIRDFIHTAVNIGARVVPGTENSLDGFHELDLRIAREVLALFLAVERLEAADKLLHVLGGQLDILLDALLLLDLVDDLLKLRLRQLHDDVGEHLDEAAVGVVSETRVVGKFGKALDNGVVKAQIEDGVHHAGHGSARARTHGDEQRVGRIGKLLAADFLHLGKAVINLLLNIVVDLAAVVIVLRARLS